MKQIAIISLAVVPLLAGCAGDMVSIGKAPGSARLDAHNNEKIQSELDKLKWRVRSLKRQVSKQNKQPARIPEDELSEIKKRLSDLESLGFNARGQKLGVSEARFNALESKVKVLQSIQSDGAAPITQTGPGSSALKKDQAALSKRFDKMERDLEKDRSLVIDFLEDLDKRLSSLEGPATGNSNTTQEPKR